MQKETGGLEVLSFTALSWAAYSTRFQGPYGKCDQTFRECRGEAAL